MSEQDQTRAFILKVWHKMQDNQQMQGLEKIIANVILIHPEYTEILNTKNILTEIFSPEQNPFYHMGMHIALEEQLMSDRPTGMTHIYAQLTEKYSDHHHLQHAILGCLHTSLMNAEAHQQMPDENSYLQCVQKLL